MTLPGAPTVYVAVTLALLALNRLPALCIGKLLGHVAWIGHDPRENTYLVRELQLASLYGPERAAIDMAPARCWQNLLEVQSSRAANLLFGDAGFAQLLIHKDDLQRQDLARVYVNEESS